MAIDQRAGKGAQRGGLRRPFRLEPPPLGPDRIPRPRLASVLGERWRSRVVLMRAGAGFGKTTLLAQAVALNRLAPAGDDLWIGCCRDDRVASHLAAGIAGALGIPEPGRDRVAVLADALWRRSPRSVSLILDDVHEIERGSGGAALLDELIDSLPGNVGVVLSGRTEPPFSLARREAQGAVVRLGERDLCLTRAEQADLARVRGVAPEALGELGGWPALAELCVAAGVDGVERFLWEEVLARLVPSERRALALLVTVGGGDAELVAAILGEDVDVVALARSLPLVAVDEAGTVVPHALWERVVAGELGPGELVAARQRAGGDFRRRGDHESAFNQFAAAGDWDGALGTAEDACIAAGLEPLSPGMLHVWLDMLPVDDHPVRLLLETIAARIGGRGDDAVALGVRALEGFRSRGDVDGEIAALVHTGYVAMVNDDRENLQRLFARVLELDATGHPAVQAVAAFGRGAMAQLAGLDEMTITELDRIPDGALGREWSSRADWLRVQALIMLGRPEEALHPATRSAANAGPMFHGGRAAPHFVRWYSGRPMEVLAAGVVAGSAAETTSQDLFLAGVYTAVMYAYGGRLDEARSALTIARRNVRQGPAPRALLAAANAAVAVAEGDDMAGAEHVRGVLAEGGLRDGPIERSLRRFLALAYVLAPEAREHWDTVELGPAFVRSRALARGLLAVRGGAAPEAVRDVSAGVVIANLPIRWAMELAAGGEHGWGVDLAGQLVTMLGSPAHEALQALAASSRPPARAAGLLARRIPRPPDEALVVRALGPLALERGGSPIVSPVLRRGRVRGLLLLLVARRVVNRDTVAATLWPDLEPEHAAHNLRQTLTHLNSVLEPHRPAGSATWFVRSDGDVLQLTTDESFTVDAWELERLLDEAARAEDEGATARALELLLEGVAWWRGDYLADAVHEAWAAPERDRIRGRFVAGALRAGSLLTARGSHGRAADLAAQVLEVEPWSEAAYRLLIAARSGGGDRAGALRAVDRCRAMLLELGVEAEPETELIVASVTGARS